VALSKETMKKPNSKTTSTKAVKATTATTALGHIVPKPRKVPQTLAPTARSLKPGLWISEMFEVPEPSEEAQAIRHAWRFEFPVTQATASFESDPQVILARDQRTSVGRDTSSPEVQHG
jgi:hypothetical protein